MSTPPEAPQTGTLRLAWLALGWLFFVLGMLGVALPVLPTTPFLLLALWAFSRSSPRLHRWLYSHRTFGPALQRWHRHRIIPLHAKLLIALTMSGSLVYLAGFSSMPANLIWLVTLCMLVVAGYLLTRPSRLRTEE